MTARVSIVTGFLCLVFTTTVGQFCTVPSSTLKNIPFNEMTLYVQQTGTAEGDAFVGDLLKKYWTLTPNFQFVSYSKMQELRNDENALFLEHWRKELIKTQGGSDAADRGQPSYSTSMIVESNFVVDDLLHLLAPPFFVKPRVGKQFRAYSGHMSILVISKGGTERPMRVYPGNYASLEMALSDTLAEKMIAYVPIAIQSWEAKGAIHGFRHAMLLKGLSSAIKIVQRLGSEGDEEKLMKVQIEAYSSGMAGYKERRMMIPLELFDEKLHRTFKEVFKEQFVPIDLKELDKQYRITNVDALLMLPIDDRLFVIDLKNDMVVYVDEVKGKANKTDIRRWGYELSMLSKKIKVDQ